MAENFHDFLSMPTWAAECDCKCGKEKDAQKGKVRWTLEGAERATILMVVGE